jgi:hypothetical protein
MDLRRLLFGGALAIGLVAGGYVIGQGPPPPNVDPNRHPNLAEAQRACDHAYQKLRAAQSANEYDMQGHAKRAEQLLTDASREIKLAALTANGKRP